MSNLMQRAKDLIASKKNVVGVLAILPLVAATKNVQAVAIAQPYFFSGSSAFIHTSQSGGTDVPVTASLGATGINPLRLNSGPTVTSDTISIDGSTFASNSGSYVALRWNGFLNTSYFPVGQSNVGVAYDFTISQGGSGGSYTWTLKNNIGGVELDAAQSSPVSSLASQQYTGSLLAPVVSPLASNWTSELDIYWTGISLPSTLFITVPPSSSVDLSVSTPEPASLGVLAIGGVALLARRRRRA